MSFKENWKKPLALFVDVWQYLVIIVIMIIAAILYYSKHHIQVEPQERNMFAKGAKKNI